jgi:hypothetical protein
MKKLFIKATITTILLSVTQLSIAAGPGWITSAKIKKIVITIDGGINFRLTPELSGCTSNSGYGPAYASVYPNHAGINRIHSTLLLAYMADKPVAVYLSDDTCRVGEIELGGRVD